MRTHAAVAVPRAMPDARLKPVRTETYTGPTYYGQPVVKPSYYGWLVWSYIYVAGMSGAAQVIAALANMMNRPRLGSVVRNGRYLATAGSAVGSVLLIADLHTPKRWYNMLRIFRRTSPMSIGSYILTTFGISSGITALAQMLGMRQPSWLRRMAAVAQVPAAIAGAGMGSYTGALLSATSTPMWAAAPRLLTARFASSSVATAAAALSLAEHLWGDRRNAATLDRLAFLATAADAGFSAAAKRQYRAQGVATSLREASPDAIQDKLGTGLGHILPLVCHGLAGAMPQHSRKLSVAAALGVLAGGLLLRSSALNAGNQSARRPQDYLSFTQSSPPAMLQSERRERIAH